MISYGRIEDIEDGVCVVMPGRFDSEGNWRDGELPFHSCVPISQNIRKDMIVQLFQIQNRVFLYTSDVMDMDNLRSEI